MNLNKDIIIRNYEKPSHPTAFSAPNQIRNYYQNYDKNIKIDEIKKILQEIDSYTLHREFKKPRIRNPYYIYRKRDQIQMDLIDVSKHKNENDGITFLLVAIDSFTKFAWIIAMKKKDAITTLQAIKQIIDKLIENDEKPKCIFFDRGKEFVNRLVTNYLNEQEIKHLHPFSEIKAGIAERFNRTIQKLIFKYCTKVGHYRYIDVLPKLLLTYNTRGHRTLNGITPQQADTIPINNKKQEQIRNGVENEIENKVNKAHLDRYLKYKKVKPRYTIGTKVRINKLLNTFERGYDEQFSREQFEIVDINVRMPIPMYKIKSVSDNEIILGGFYENELQPLQKEKYQIKILKKKRINGKNMLYVSWIGFDDSHNCWINAEKIMK